MEDKNKRYGYADAGYSRFFRRSIDNPGTAVNNLAGYARTAQQTTRAVDFDQQPVSGTLSGVTKVGTGITLDGVVGRISIFDTQGNEVTRIGELDG